MKDFQFFAASFCEWVVTTDRRELPDLIGHGIITAPAAHRCRIILEK